jgi:predicted small secreted protein
MELTVSCWSATSSKGGYGIMGKNASVTLALLLLIAALPLLGACNTTAGAGQDLSATGHAVTNSAEKLKP